MSIEFIMTICALTFTSPYYDCSDEWDIMIYDDKIIGSDALGTADWTRNVFDDRKKISLVHDYKTKEGKHDHLMKGGGILWHEILHMKCECDWHKRWDVLEKIKGKNHTHVYIPPIPQSVLPYLNVG